MSTKVVHVFPLIGGGVIGTEYLKSQGVDIENINKCFSLSGAKPNELPLIRNRGVDIEYWDEVYADVECDCITCGGKDFNDTFEDSDFDIECKKVEACIDNNKILLNDADIMLSIPPCNSLSMLNCSNTSRTGKNNPASQIIMRCVEFALKSDIGCFIFENAPRLATAGGLPLLQQIERRIEKYPEYSMNVVKTNSVWHGMAQRRERTFVFLTKSINAHALDFNVNLATLTDLIGDIDLDPEKYRVEPQNDVQKFLKGTNTSLKGNKPITAENYFDKWNKISNLLGRDKFTGMIGEDIRDVEDIDKWITEVFETFDWGDYDMTKEIRFIKHIHKKMNDGKGYWEWEPISTESKAVEGIYATTGIIAKSMGRFVHPEYPRCLSFREECRLMGIPDDFVIEDKEKFRITQNVPSFTFAAMIDQYFKLLTSVKHKFAFQQVNNKDLPIFVGDDIETCLQKKHKNSNIDINQIDYL